MAIGNQNDHAYTLENLTSLPPLSLPLDLAIEILSRLPVRFLVQFRSVCKLWNSIISDHKFAKKHLSLSTTHRISSIYYSGSRRRHSFDSYRLDYIFSTVYANVTELEYPPPNSFDLDYPLDRAYSIVGSCNGIICLTHCFSHSRGDCFVLVWNPSIRKFKKLPSVEKPKQKPKTPTIIFTNCGFGYDHVNDKYIVLVAFQYFVPLKNIEVKVHTLGTNFWKSVEGFPFGCVPYLSQPGTFVRGTINWLPFKDRRIQSFIVSFDLINESYQKILHPDYDESELNSDWLALGALKDYLCITYHRGVWIMKEYGNKESWTKIFTHSDKWYLSKAIYMFKDDQVLLEASYNRAKKLILHDPKIGNVKFINIDDRRNIIPENCTPEVCVESLISPWEAEQNEDYIPSF